MVATYAVWYNFVRINKSLRVTPAMAAGITDTLWSMKDVVVLLDARETPTAKRGAYKPRQPHLIQHCPSGPIQTFTYRAWCSAPCCDYS